MQFFHGHFLTALAALALAIPGISLADDEPGATPAVTSRNYRTVEPATCSQFEKLFPQAIKYPEQGYYTLIINGSSVVCLYDIHECIAAAFVLTQARRNAPKLAQVLHMDYSAELTERSKRFHHAFLYNYKALFRNVQQNSTPTDSENEGDVLRLPFTLVDLLGSFIWSRKHIFFDWSRRGIVLVNKNRSEKITLSAHNAQSPIVHFDTNKTDSALAELYAPLQAFHNYYLSESRKGKKLLRTTKLDKITHIHTDSNLVLGVTKDGIRALGRPNSKYPLDEIPLCSPPFPKKRSEWPATTLASLQKETEKQPEQQSAEPPDSTPASTPAPTPKPEQQQKAILLPLTPKEALDAYLKHLQSF